MAPSAASFPLSFGQLRLCKLAERAELPAAFTESRRFDVTGPFEPAALCAAVSMMVDRHEPLRTTFMTTADGTPVQRVHKEGSAPVEVVDLTEATAPESEAAVSATMTRPFDLANGPLLRVAVLRLGPLDWRLVFVSHHLVADAWSLRIFFRELAAAYAARVTGVPLDLAPLPVQYVDWAAWQRETLTEQGATDLLSWWRQELAGASWGLPTTRRRVTGRVGGRVTLKLPADVTRELTELARTENSTVFTALAAACGLVVGRKVGADTMVLLVPTANREQPQTHGMLGFFVDVMPLRVDIAGTPPVSELLGRVTAALVRAHAHKALPCQRIETELRPRAGTAPVHFTYRPAPQVGGGLTLTGCTVVERPVAAVGAKFDLAITADEHEQGLRIGAEFDRTLFDQNEITANGARLPHSPACLR